LEFANPARGKRNFGLNDGNVKADKKCLREAFIQNKLFFALNFDSR